MDASACGPVWSPRTEDQFCFFADTPSQKDSSRLDRKAPRIQRRLATGDGSCRTRVDFRDSPRQVDIRLPEKNPMARGRSTKSSRWKMDSDQ